MSLFIGMGQVFAENFAKGTCPMGTVKSVKLKSIAPAIYSIELVFEMLVGVVFPF
jgi:hypothetical protein